MLNMQKSFVEKIDRMISVLNTADIRHDNLLSLKESIEQQEILIPVIGDFSAGKSTLLNHFLEAKNNILPTAITPETSLAAELRYDTDERIEAIKDNQIIKTYMLNEFDLIKQHASEYTYLRVYLNNSQLQVISPLVLVDMPGFQSPVEEHNKAINEYLNRGAYFVILVSATEGSLHRSSFRQINYILDFDRDFSVIVSKANLVSEDNLKEICQKVTEQIESEVGLIKEPVPVGKDAVIGFKEILNTLNPDELFTRITLPLMKKVVYEVQSSVNVKLSAIQRTGEENNSVIEKLVESLNKLEKKQENLIKEAQNPEAIGGQVQKIINNIGQKLSSNIDLLVSVASNQGSDALSQEISDIVQGALITDIKRSVNDLTDSVTLKLTAELKDVDSALQDYNLDSSLIDTFTVNFKNTMENALNSLNKMVEKRQSVENAGMAYKFVTSTLAITTSIINPVVELVIVFLPEIISFFRSQIQKRKEEMAAQERLLQIRNQILTQVIPDVKRQVKPKITQILQEQASALVEQIVREYSVLLDNKQKEIMAAEEERKAHIEEVNKKIAIVKQAKEITDSVYKSLF